MKPFHAALFTASLLAAQTGFAQDKLTDPQIAGIVVTANRIDVETGRLAKQRAAHKTVVQFAEQMITDHTAVNKQAAALAKKLNVTPEQSEVSRSLEGSAKQVANRLSKLSGAQFDAAYVDHEVAYHRQVLEAIDKVLVPNATNAELKALITKVRPAIAAHLDHAKMLQGSLGK